MTLKEELLDEISDYVDTDNVKNINESQNTNCNICDIVERNEDIDLSKILKNKLEGNK